MGNWVERGWAQHMLPPVQTAKYYMFLNFADRSLPIALGSIIIRSVFRYKIGKLLLNSKHPNHITKYRIYHKRSRHPQIFGPVLK